MSTSPEVKTQPGKAADSTDPALIPGPSQAGGFSAAFAYADGKYKWTPAQSARFEWIAHISVTGDAKAAAYARVQDIERFDAAPGQFPAFAAERLTLGHSCGIGYVSLDSVAEVVDALNIESMGSDPWMLWVAWWWGKDVPPTQALVHMQLAKMGVDVPARRIAACQWLPGGAGRPYDTSVIFEPHVLHRPQGWPS